MGGTSPRIVVSCTSTADAVFNDILPIVGGWQSQGGQAATYIVPQTFQDFQQSIGGGFPNFAGLYCLTSKLKSELGTDSNKTGYLQFRVDLEFGELKAWTKNDNCQSAIISGEISVEGLALPQGNCQWTSGTNSGKAFSNETDIQAQKWLPFLAIEVNFPFKPTLPLDTFANLASNVNSANVIIGGTTFTAGQLLFQGAQYEPSTSCDGSIGWSRVLKFGARKDDWNKAYSTSDGSFETFTINGTTLYPTGDLNGVLTA